MKIYHKTKNILSDLKEIPFKELKTYTEEELLKGKPDETLELYEEVKQAILNLSPEIEVVPQNIMSRLGLEKETFQI